MSPPKKQVSSDTTGDEIFENICYQNNGAWFQLPEWANFFLKSGFALSHHSQSHTRFVSAMSLPTRAYASVLLASGIACTRAGVIGISDNDQYFQMLKELADGTAVIYRDGTRKLKGRKQGVKVIEGKTYLGIQKDEGLTNTVIYRSIDQARSIEVANRDEIKLPRQQKGREISQVSPLAKAILGAKQVYDFTLQTKLECVLIGPSSIISQEIETQLSACDNALGTIADLIRVRDFLPTGSAYRSYVKSHLSRINLKLESAEMPYVVIFDGAPAFIKWRSAWRKSNWVILLDQTEHNFQYAVEQVNDEFLYRSEKQHQIKLPPIPSGIEVMLFTIDL